MFEAKILTRYRKDVVEVLPQQCNIELTGFVCGIPAGVLPEDSYQIAMLCKDKCTRQRLYAKTNVSLEVSEGMIQGLKR